MLAVILAIITTAIASVLAGFLNNKFNINIQGFSIFVIFPIGAAIIGFVAASGFAIYRGLKKAVIKSYMLLLCLAIGVLSFFTTTFVDYRYMVSYAEDYYAQELSQATEEEKKAFYEEISFVNYLKQIHEETKVTISSRRGKGAEIDNPIVSMISFWLSVLGGGFGAWLLFITMVGERTKDKKTGEYRDLKYRALFDDEAFENLQKILTDKKSNKDLAKFLLDHPHDKTLDSHNLDRGSVKVLKTRSTGEGQVVAERHRGMGKDSKVVARAELELDSAETNELMSTILSIDPKERF